ncbi:MAG: hypothetical protein COA43_11195 [Robiginitomaculum sp.]|nr:MAG: hypothetical protein COA43_11195 [Robiginitomaculum sp.]
MGLNYENTTKHKRALELQEQGHHILIKTTLKIFTADEMADIADKIEVALDEREYTAPKTNYAPTKPKPTDKTLDTPARSNSLYWAFVILACLVIGVIILQ